MGAGEMIRVTLWYHDINDNGIVDAWHNEYSVHGWHGINGAIRIALRKDRRREKTKPYRITAERSFAFYD